MKRKAVSFWVFFAMVLTGVTVGPSAGLCVNTATGPGSEERRMKAGEELKKSESLVAEAKSPEVAFSEGSPDETKDKTEEIPFFVERIRVTGNAGIADDRIRAVVAPYEGRELTLTEARAAAEKITALYRENGYITCRAYLPPQKMDAKVLEIRVLEGKLSAVEVQGNRFFNKDLIARAVEPLKNNAVQYKSLMRALAKINLHPDREVKAVIIPGKEVGTSDLVLDVKDQFPLHVSGEVNNFGTKLTGKERYSVGLRHSNLFGLDDILAARVQFGEEVTALSTQYVLPVGPYDTKIGGTFSYTDVGIGGDFTALDMGGYAYNYSFFIDQPFYRNDFVELTWTGAFETKDITNEVLNTVSSEDHLRMLRTGLNAEETDPFGRSFLVNDFTFGVPWAGASDKYDPKLSRSGSGAGFFKYDVAFNRVHPVYDSTNLFLRASAQATNDRLVSAEQYDIGGIYSVRGYPQSDYTGDFGFGGSLEVRVPLYFIPRDVKVPGTDVPLWNRVSLVGFIDGAYAKLKGPAVGELPSKTAVGLGGGLRFDLPRNLTGRFEWAGAAGDKPTDGSNSQFYFSISGDFF